MARYNVHYSSMGLNSPYSKNPIDAVRDAMDQLPHAWESLEQKTAVEQVLRIAIPPLLADDILRASTILYVAKIIDKTAYRLVWRYVARVARRFDARDRKSEISHPKYFAMIYLYAEGRRYYDVGIHAVQLIDKLTERVAVPPKFSGLMYYRHFLSFRHTCQQYWQFSDEVISHDLFSLKAGLQRFVAHFLASSHLSDTKRRKFDHTAQLLSGELLFGGALPRESGPYKGTRQIGGEIELSPAHLESEIRPVRVMSAHAGEEIAEDDGVTFGVTYPHQSTHSDRHRINTAIRSGYPRTNVPTTADMNHCCLSTHRAYLTYAERHADEALFSLIWIVAFLGLNHHRPIVEKLPDYDYPRHDEILVCPKRFAIMYACHSKAHHQGIIRYFRDLWTGIPARRGKNR